MNPEIVSRPIPDLFLAFDGTRFDHCTTCDSDLLEPDAMYAIERAFRGDEIVWELAICFGCRERFDQTFSDQSRVAISRYFKDRVDLEARTERLLEEIGPSVDGWVSYCLVTGEPASSCGERVIYGTCVGEEFLFCLLPYMLSGRAHKELMSTLSNRSLAIVRDAITSRLRHPGLTLAGFLPRPRPN